VVGGLLTSPQTFWRGYWHNYNLIIQGLNGRNRPNFESEPPDFLLQYSGAYQEFQLDGFSGWVSDRDSQPTVAAFKTRGRALRIQVWSTNAREFFKELRLASSLDASSNKFQVIWPLPD